MAKKYNDMSEAATDVIDAPAVPYTPPRPRTYRPPIAIIGCGGISGSHLKAYQAMGLNVVALCDVVRDRAEARRAEFFPEARAYDDFKEVLRRDDIEVVDLATHPQDREYLIPEALQARKHVLSQKPFVLDLDKGHAFADLADRMGVRLAVNQNGRWSPHWSWTRHAVQGGLVGEVNEVQMTCRWNHDEWIAETHFNRVHHIVLYDYAIHWFDALASFTAGLEARQVFSTLTHARQQVSRPPLLAQTVVEFDHGQASLVFDGATRIGGRDEGAVAGTKGTLRYSGKDLNAHRLELATSAGLAVPQLTGTWFIEGFMGSMGELLAAIEDDRTPTNNGRDNLRGLAISCAAVVSAETGRLVKVGEARKFPVETCSVAPA